MAKTLKSIVGLLVTFTFFTTSTVYAQNTPSEDKREIKKSVFKNEKSENIYSKQIPEEFYPKTFSLKSNSFLRQPDLQQNSFAQPAHKRNIRNIKRENGNSFQTPYFENFEEESSLNDYTIIDANNDDKTWKWESNNAKYDTHSTNYADDWLITPAIQLEKNRLYCISFKAASRGPFYPEQLEVKWGNSPSAEGMANTLVESQMIQTERHKYMEFERYLSVVEDTPVYIGFHALSEPNSFTLYITDISVDEGLPFEAPDVVTNLVATPDLTGAKSATIKFNAPSKTIGGQQLSSLEKIEVWRNNDILIEIINNPEIGSLLSVTDNTIPENGNYTYKIIPYNEYGIGLKSEVSVYVGEDIPATPQNSKMKDNGNNSFTFSWDAVTNGANGGYINTDNLYYKIYEVTNNQLGEQIDEVTEPIVTISDKNINGGAPRIEYIVVRAANDAGESEPLIGMIVAGEASKTPFSESFPQAEPQHFWWTQTQGNSEFELAEGESSDNDGGSIAFFTMTIGDEASMNSEKITMKDTKSPKLIFDYFAEKETPCILRVEANAGQKGEEDILLHTINMSEIENTGWNKAIIDLSSLKNEDYAIIKLHAQGDVVFSYFLLDNIQIYDLFEQDLSVEINAPEEATVGIPAPISVTIKNVGENEITQGAPSVDIYVNNKKIESFSITEALAPLTGSFSHRTEYSPTAIDGDNITVKAVLSFNDDMNIDNNEAAQDVKVLQNIVPTVTALQGISYDKEIQLNWEKPELYQLGTDVVEDFEDTNIFPAFSTGGVNASNQYGNYGEWRVYDGDGMHTYTWQDYDNYENASGIMSWQVFRPSVVFEGDENRLNQYGAHSGEQYLSSFNAALQGGKTPTDDWLISPELDKTNQTVTFYSKELSNKFGFEKGEILYSTTGNSIEDFKLLSTFEQHSINWTEMQFKLPYGTKYFAIRCTSEDNFALVVDDISFRNAVESGNGDGMTIESYNIYRDGELIATVDGTNNSFTDKDTENTNHTYQISVVYNPNIESPLSEPANITTDIKDIRNVFPDIENENIEVYSIDGKLIANGVGVYKTLRNGTYIIKKKADGTTLRVIK